MSLPERDEIPPSSAPRAASSTPTMRGESAGPRNAHILPTIEQTPSRGPSNLVMSCLNISSTTNLQNEPGPPPMPLLKQRYPSNPQAMTKTSNITSLETPSKHSLWIHRHDTFGQEIENTPINRSKALRSTTIKNTASSPIGNENDISIYKTLGWDDEGDEMLWFLNSCV